MKSQKLLINGNFLKVNGKHIMSNGYFAYDGCHKIYILEDKKDIATAMAYGFRLYPTIELQKTYKCSCPLKFIANMKFDKTYVGQGCKARWSEVKATENEIKNYKFPEMMS